MLILGGIEVKEKKEKKEKKVGIGVKIILFLILVIIILTGVVFIIAKIRNNIKTELSINTENLLYEKEKDIYVLENTELSGSLNSTANVKKLSYKVKNDSFNYTKTHDIEIEKEWKIEDLDMLFGKNEITVTAIDKNGEKLDFDKIDVFYTHEGNVKILETKDSDDDGLNDYFELCFTNTDFRLEDTDENGTLDGEEDLDNDGLSNFKEQELGTDPLLSDSDGDGINDGKEVENGTNPLERDTDQDGIDDKQEEILGINPLKKDSNGDGVEDGKENYEVTLNDSSDTENVELVAKVKGNQSSDLKITSATAVEYLQEMPGLIGKPYNIHLEDEFQGASLTFDIKEKLDNSKEYSIYYFNEKNLELERVSNQTRNGNKITAELEHFSTYLVLEDEKVSEARDHLLNELYKVIAKNNKIQDSDIDQDGFTDDEDETPYIPDGYKYLSNYMKAMYPGKDAICLFTWQPVENRPDVAAFKGLKPTSQGHTFMAYYDSKKDKVTYAGLRTNGNHGDIYFGLNGSCQSYVYYDNQVHTAGNILGPGKYQDTNKVEGDSWWNVGLPIVLDTSKYDLFEQYCREYNKKYNLYTNNCTTFALECLDYLGVSANLYGYIDYSHIFSTLFDIYKDSKEEDVLEATIDNASGFVPDILDAVFAKGCSPGQLAYCIEQFYPEERLSPYLYYKDKEIENKDTEENIGFGFTSQMALDKAVLVEASLTEEEIQNARKKSEENTTKVQYLDQLEIIDKDQYSENEADSFVDKIGVNQHSRGKVDIDGNSYEHGIEVWIARWNYTAEQSWAYSTYQLDGKYHTIDGKGVLIKSYNTQNFDTTIDFIGDGETLVSYHLTQDSEFPFEVHLNVAGVKELKIYGHDNIAVSGGTSFGFTGMTLDSEEDSTEAKLGSKYEIVKKNISWEEAKKECEEAGGHLATITSQAEQDYITELNSSNSKLWIGAYRTDDDLEKWMWVTGEKWNYENWNDGEPNNSSNVKSNENRAVIWTNGKWNDLNENNTGEQSGYICEWD